MEALRNTAQNVTSHTKSFFHAFSLHSSIKDLVSKASRGEMFALVVNELSIGDALRSKGLWVLVVFLLAALLFCTVHKACVGSFKAIRSTAKVSVEFMAMLLCIAVIVNIIK